MVDCKNCIFHQELSHPTSIIHICRLFNLQINGTVDECTGKMTEPIKETETE